MRTQANPLLSGLLPMAVLVLAPATFAVTGDSVSAQSPQSERSIRAASAADAKRTPLTPASVPYVWRNVEIVGGGFVSGIIFHPRQKDLIYARTDIGGAYRWDPAAKRWVPLQDGVGADDWNLLGVESLALDPTDAKRVYVAAGTYVNDWAGNGAMLRSSDQGRTWQRTGMPFKLGGNEEGRSMGERLAVDPNHPRILLFGSRPAGLWKSADYGATWNRVESFPKIATSEAAFAGEGFWRRPQGIVFVAFDGKSGTRGTPTPTVYAGVGTKEASLYRSRDAGKTWEAVPGQPVGFLPHHAVLAENGTLYVTYGNAPGPNGMTDGAVHKLDVKSGAWTEITPLKPGSGDGAGRFGYAGLAVDAKNPNVVMVTTMDRWNPGDDIFRSIDGGKTWKPLKPGAVRDSSAAPYLNWGRESADLGHWIGDIEIDPHRPGHVLYVTGATIWGSDDANAVDAGKPTHWTVRAQGLEETAVQDLISPPEGPHLISALGDLGGFRHDDLSVSPRAGMFQNPIFTTTTSLDYAENNPSVIARVGNGGRGTHGAHSTDGGATWTPFTTEPGGNVEGGDIAVSSDGTGFVWSPRGDNTVPHLSVDRGVTWQRCQGLPDQVGSIVAERQFRSTMFYALDTRTGKLYASMANGSFGPTGTPGIPAGRGRLWAAPGQTRGLWVTMGNQGLYRWARDFTRFEKIPSVERAEAFGFGKAAPGKDYPALYLTGMVGGISGVFRSDDEGATWVRINDDAHQYGSINQAITGDPRIYGRVYLGTNGRGILYADPVPAAAAEQTTAGK